MKLIAYLLLMLSGTFGALFVILLPPALERWEPPVPLRERVISALAALALCTIFAALGYLCLP